MKLSRPVPPAEPEINEKADAALGRLESLVMPLVVIDGIEYVPKAEVPDLTDERLRECLESLTEIQYFAECSHKHRAWAWNAMNALAPELAKLPPAEAYERIHGAEA